MHVATGLYFARYESVDGVVDGVVKHVSGVSQALLIYNKCFPYVMKGKNH
jgi:hypothetical protein